ncbi:hypothetical protein DSM104329_04131 [Capillimicrobium parvum]|uniref:Uncharacterized protein n=2 Tax=Capillimicrobium parvum TaxID=2884022 RepID=A0A9E7C1P7_9ACTN|nr:hypothetical protein DSM104329_04131 [Capillimicrobium parvum]
MVISPEPQNGTPDRPMSSTDTTATLESPERPVAPQRPRGTRLGFLIPGIVAAVLAVGLLALGGLALWGDAQKDSAGYLSTRTERIGDNTRALATKNLDVNLGGAGRLVESSEFGKVRLQATSRTGKPLFIGIAPTRDVARYLQDVSYSTVTDISTGPFEADYTRHAGTRWPAPPARRDFWAASSQGAGRQTLTWKVADGDWSVVVMNADGSPDVEASISAGAKLPFLDEVGWVALGGGIALVILATGLIVLGTRPPSGPAARAVGAGVPRVAL